MKTVPLELSDRDNDSLTMHVNGEGVWVTCTSGVDEVKQDRASRLANLCSTELTPAARNCLTSRKGRGAFVIFKESRWMGSWWLATLLRGRRAEFR